LLAARARHAAKPPCFVISPTNVRRRMTAAPPAGVEYLRRSVRSSRCPRRKLAQLPVGSLKSHLFVLAMQDTPEFGKTTSLEIATNARRLREEGAGNAGRSTRPQPCVRKVKAHKSSHHRYAETFRHSPRDGFTAYFAVSPETGLVCLRHRPRWLSIAADLIPASGYQDATTLPSATGAFVLRAARVHRIPRSTFVTTRNAPPDECGT
jgi:hypothetical protein